MEPSFGGLSGPPPRISLEMRSARARDRFPGGPWAAPQMLSIQRRPARGSLEIPAGAKEPPCGGEPQGEECRSSFPRRSFVFLEDILQYIRREPRSLGPLRGVPSAHRRRAGVPTEQPPPWARTRTPGRGPEIEKTGLAEGRSRSRKTPIHSYSNSKTCRRISSEKI